MNKGKREEEKIPKKYQKSRAVADKLVVGRDSSWGHKLLLLNQEPEGDVRNIASSVAILGRKNNIQYKTSEM
jgi:hypothetical protein